MDSKHRLLQPFPDKSLFSKVVTYSDCICNCQNPILGLSFGVGYESIGKNRFHSEVLNIVSFLNAPIDNFMPILDIEEGFLIHVKDPSIVITVDCSSCLVQSSSFEFRVVR